MREASISKDLTILLSVITFIFTFNLFYSFAPIIVPFDLELAYKFLPEAYARSDDQPTKIVVKITTYQDLLVLEYWYYWPYDGFEERDDWEPVVVYVKDDKVVATAFRIHYSWRVILNPPTSENTHVKITFNYLWHTPLIIEPPPGWTKINIKPEIDKPPEELNHALIIGVIYPQVSAFASALLYASLASGAVYFGLNYLRRFY